MDAIFTNFNHQGRWEEIVEMLKVLVEDRAKHLSKIAMSNIRVRLEGPDDRRRPYGQFVIECDAGIRRIPLEKVVALLDSEMRGKFLSVFPPLDGVVEKSEPLDPPEEVKYLLIDDLRKQKIISVRTHCALLNESVRVLDDVTRYTEEELLKIPNFGRKSLKELKALLASKGLSLPSVPLPKDHRRNPAASWEDLKVGIGP